MFGNQSHTYVCVPCRNVARGRGGRTCPTCQQPMACAGYRWRAPRRRDTAAWKRLDAGQWNTEPARRSTGTGVGYTFTSPLDTEPDTPARWRRPDAARDARTVLADDPYSDAARALATHPDTEVRRTVARHDLIHAASLTALVRDPDPRVATVAAGHPHLPTDPTLRRKLARSPHAGVRKVLAARPDTDPRLLRRLLADPDPTVAQEAAENPAARLRDLAGVPLAWIPTGRDPEIGATGHQVRILAKLRDVDARLTLREARTLLTTLT